MTSEKQSNYRWYILAIATLTLSLVASAPRQCMPVLFKEISEDLGLDLVQVGTVWGMNALAGAVAGLLGGLVVDRFGIKRTLVTACLLIAIVIALRGFTWDFMSLSVAMFLFGIFASLVPKAGHKSSAIWFPSNRLGMANGILSIGMTMGSMMGSMISATILSPLLGGWRNVFFLYAAAPLVLSLLWLTTGREPHQVESSAEETGTAPFRTTLLRILRNKQVWIIGIIQMGQMGAMQGANGYLPIYLRNIGWSPVTADSIMGIRSGVMTLFTIPMVMLSDRMGLRKGLLIPMLLSSGICLGLVPFFDGATLWALLILASLIRSGQMALFYSLITETEGIGGRYIGTAIGLTSTVSQLGGFFAPPLGNSLALIEPGMPFIFWAGLSLVTLLGFFFIKERKRPKTGHPGDAIMPAVDG